MRRLVQKTNSLTPDKVAEIQEEADTILKAIKDAQKKAGKEIAALEDHPLESTGFDLSKIVEATTSSIDWLNVYDDPRVFDHPRVRKAHRAYDDFKKKHGRLFKILRRDSWHKKIDGQIMRGDYSMEMVQNSSQRPAVMKLIETLDELDRFQKLPGHGGARTHEGGRLPAYVREKRADDAALWVKRRIGFHATYEELVRRASREFKINEDAIHAAYRELIQVGDLNR